MKKIMCLVLLCLVLLMCSGVAMAKKDVYVMKYGFVDEAGPFKTVGAGYATVLKSEVERLSGGRIKVEVYPAGQLGDQRSCTQQVKAGAIESYGISPGVLATLYYPRLGVFEMPFLFSSEEVLRGVCDRRNYFTRKLLDDIVEKTGIRILSLMPFGYKNLSNSIRPVKLPEDMEGLKMRTQEIIPHMRMMESWGAKPIPIAYLELYTSLQTGVVDGMTNPPGNYLAKKFYQVQKYLTVTHHIVVMGATIVNEKWFQSLPNDLKLALVEGERAAQFAYYGLGEIIDATGVEELESKGMIVYRPTPQEVKAFKDKAVPYVKEWMKKEYGADFVAEFLAVVEDAEREIRREMESLDRGW